jgi:hypothetical protein
LISLSDNLNADPLPWLLEEDPENPSIRYFALRDLQDKSPASAEVRKAQKAIMESGPVPKILDAQDPEGFWVKPGGGYSPKYQGTVWQIILLAELGADPEDERVKLGCEYLLSHSIAANGAFSVHPKPVPSGAIPCLNGNLIFALQKLGFGDDPRVKEAVKWQVEAIMGEGDFQYLKSGTTGPGFGCSANGAQPCAWGANKVLKAFDLIPETERTTNINRAIQIGVDLLFSRDPAEADYPFSGRVSSTWKKFGFPLSYWSDILETTAILVNLGYEQDPRLENAYQLILGRQDDEGRWKLENTMNRMWFEVEKKKEPSKWITLRALRVLKKAKSHN